MNFHHVVGEGLVGKATIFCETPFSQRLQLNDFINANVTRYNSLHAALKALRKVGGPPSTPADVSYPTEQAQIVLEALPYLAAAHDAVRPAFTYIGDNWSYIGPWVEFFLKEIILARQGPRTNKGIDFLDNVLYAIRMLLSREPPSLPGLLGTRGGRDPQLILARRVETRFLA
ncbi:hypothetical protein Moror_9682 [Moniliophthora roreri MCA 2997]|uniref:Uncharacterized protein n=2 Tax=Moniliophthora roreri TaxID=221103 RepID=V2WIN9_MONRO|nr:hypothetical protein Moror_9682 [Moniliophthora roreri MCA 2997]